MQLIYAEELKSRLDAGQDIHLVDVREPDENAAFNIGGKLIPLGKILSMQLEDIDEFKDEELICYCRSGQRCMQACLILETFGFTNMKNLAGGMLEWQQKFGG